MRIWKEISGYEGYYAVSNMGDVRSIDRLVKGKSNYPAKRIGKILSPSLSKKGYLRVLLIKNNIRKNIAIHRLVALAFVDNKENYPQVNHINGVKTDNTTGNLEWCDQLHNNRHARSTGLNIAKKGTESHSYGRNNKYAYKVVNIITGEIKVIAELVQEYPYSRRYLNQMIEGSRTNKTNYRKLPEYVKVFYDNITVYKIGVEADYDGTYSGLIWKSGGELPSTYVLPATKEEYENYRNLCTDSPLSQQASPLTGLRC